MNDGINDSTLAFIRSTLKSVNRIRLLRTRAQLFCPECHILRQVNDYFPNRECLLECNHRRPLVEPKVVETYEQSKQNRPQTRQTGWQGGSLITVTVEDAEEKAA